METDTKALAKYLKSGQAWFLNKYQGTELENKH